MSTSAPSARPRILIVDDDPIVLAVMRLMLEQAAMVFETATNADEAEAVGRRNPDLRLLITDIIMPGRNGVELAVAMRRTHPGIRTVFVSGYARPELMARGVDLDGAVLLAKPFTFDTLMGAVRAQLAAGAAP